MAESVGDTTLLEAIATLKAEGFGGDFGVVMATEPAVRCRSCGAVVHAADALVIRLLRLEGESDPADEAIVAGLRCGHCGASGVLVVTYGPMADPADADVVVALHDGRAR